MPLVFVFGPSLGFDFFLKNTEGVCFEETDSGDGGSTSVESSVLEEAKGKGKALYYITLEVSAVHFFVLSVS